MVLNEEATNVSLGQKQLLTIARAILSDRNMLILDEATSSVDTRTEIQIQEAMDNLMQGRTSFVIAHRLSTIRNADLILVMENGDIVEQGTHEELLEKGGFYAELYNSQSCVKRGQSLCVRIDTKGLSPFDTLSSITSYFYVLKKYICNYSAYNSGYKTEYDKYRQQISYSDTSQHPY